MCVRVNAPSVYFKKRKPDQAPLSFLLTRATTSVDKHTHASVPTHARTNSKHAHAHTHPQKKGKPPKTDGTPHCCTRPEHQPINIPVHFASAPALHAETSACVPGLQMVQSLHSLPLFHSVSPQLRSSVVRGGIKGRNVRHRAVMTARPKRGILFRYVMYSIPKKCHISMHLQLPLIYPQHDIHPTGPRLSLVS